MYLHLSGNLFTVYSKFPFLFLFSLCRNLLCLAHCSPCMRWRVTDHNYPNRCSVYSPGNAEHLTRYQNCVTIHALRHVFKHTKSINITQATAIKTIILFAWSTLFISLIFSRSYIKLNKFKILYPMPTFMWCNLTPFWNACQLRNFSQESNITSICDIMKEEE